jgi:uncharacterized cupin superfamily protein
MDAFAAAVPQGGRWDQPRARGSSTRVLEGAVDMYCDLYAPTRLHAGESIYFDSGMGHAFIASAPGPCRFLSICSHPEHPLAAYAVAEPAIAPTPPTETRPRVARSPTST